MNKERLTTICFEGEGVTISSNNAAAHILVDFLTEDLPKKEGSSSPIRYDLVTAGPLPAFSLWQGEKRLYFGNSRHETAYILINEIIYHSIMQSKQRHAIHAGAVYDDDNCILLPGNSGKGKSSLTAWLLTKGFKYLTDELVFLGDNGIIKPFIRPISIKEKPVHSIFKHFMEEEGKIILDEKGAMFSHRLLNADVTGIPPKLNYIVFPFYKKSETTRLVPLSPAQSCAMLLESHVNARNFPGLGVSRLSSIIKRCVSFQLIYSDFDNLETTLLPVLSIH